MAAPRRLGRHRLLVWLQARRPLPSTSERRYELPTLRRVWPLLGLYLILSALWPVPWTATAWHGGWGLADLGDMPGLLPLLRTLQYLAAFTLLGYTIAEARGLYGGLIYRRQLALVRALLTTRTA